MVSHSEIHESENLTIRGFEKRPKARVMLWDEMAVVGRVARPHGLRGQLIVNVETDFPEERFQRGAEVFVNRRGQIESLTLDHVRFHQGRPIVVVSGVDTIDAAEALAGLELRVPRERLMRLPAGTFYRHELVGCRVETSQGEAVGVVTEVEGPAYASRLVVASGDDEIQIPLAREICTVVDTHARRIVIEPLDGLLDLNK
jgi:16S rRNA processing protein RimM